MCFAVAYPDRVDRLVLACTSAHFGTPDSWLERAALVRRRGIGPLVDPVLAAVVHGRHADAADMAPYRAMLEATPVEGYAGVLRGARRLGLPRAVSARSRRRHS